MILFFIKKNFWEGWDNLLWLVLANLFALTIAIADFFIIRLTLTYITDPMWLGIVLSLLLIAAGIFAITTLAMSLSKSCAELVNFKSVSYKEIITKMKGSFLSAFLFTILLAALLSLAWFSIPFYLGLQNMVGVLFASIVFWALVMFLLALQWYFPLEAQMHGGFKKTLKKSFILMFDNFGFSIFFFIYSLILLALSVVTLSIIPGISGIMLAQNNALRLRLYKYDWMEEHPDIPYKQAKKQIPWDELTAEDDENIGPRSLKSLIFPWK